MSTIALDHPDYPCFGQGCLRSQSKVNLFQPFSLESHPATVSGEMVSGEMGLQRSSCQSSNQKDAKFG
jgi:hypothetical protein